MGATLMFELAFKLIGILILCHFIFDYPLQGDFLAKAKNETAPIPAVADHRAGQPGRRADGVQPRRVRTHGGDAAGMDAAPMA